MNYKKLKYDELFDIFSNINFRVKPFLHQLVSFTYILANNLSKVFLFHDIGLGKTYTALYMMQIWKVKGKILIICPNSVIKTWKEQIEKYTDYDYAVIVGSSKYRNNLILKSNKKILIINYEGLRVVGSNKIGKHYKVDRNKIKKFPFEVLIADECHRFKNNSSLQTLIAHAINKRCRYSIFMTGTPVGENSSDLFGQTLVLNDGAIFGNDYMYFMNYYYYNKVYGYGWEPKRICNICGELYSQKIEHLKKHGISLIDYRNMGDEITSDRLILDAIKDISINYKRSECIDLPEKIYEEVSVEPTQEQIKWTQDIISGFKIDEIKSNVTYHTVKLLQITGGAIKHNDGFYLFRENPKIIELERLLESINEQVIIYHYFIQEGKIIEEFLKKKKLNVAKLNGSVKDKEHEIDLFTSGKTQILLAHPKSGGEGLNLQMSHITIYYSTGYMGTILREQSEGRTHRVGQTRGCTFIDIIMENTIDRIAFDSLKKRKDYVNDIYNYLVSVKNPS